MKFFLALLVWLLMGFFIGWGLLLFVKAGAIWLLALSFIGFWVLVGKIGCLGH
jgi:hypothetical protein